MERIIRRRPSIAFFVIRALSDAANYGPRRGQATKTAILWGGVAALGPDAVKHELSKLMQVIGTK
jgi:hypothetical protein